MKRLLWLLGVLLSCAALAAAWGLLVSRSSLSAEWRSVMAMLGGSVVGAVAALVILNKVFATKW